MYSPNDTIQIALIGAGGMGQGDARMATSLPGVKLLAACDLYDGRLQHMKEVYGADTFITRDYREIVQRHDIDAVIIQPRPFRPEFRNNRPLHRPDHRWRAVNRAADRGRRRCRRLLLGRSRTVQRLHRLIRHDR